MNPSTGVDATNQSAVIAFLSDPKSYRGDVPIVERQETHGAIVFLAGDRAYKLKRAVRYAYMDFSTLERREAMCRRELEVNRRCAPDIYLEVRPLIRDGGRIRFGDPRDRERVLDWVVVMRRFSQDALLEQKRRNGTLALPLMRTLGETVAAFHGKAEKTGDFGGADGIGAVIHENADALGAMPDIFAPREVERLIAASKERLRQLTPLLDNRKKGGSVRRCHGDLHLNNIYLDQHTPVLFDAIEFEDAFSCIDVFYDLSLLLMDLDGHGLRAHANLLLNRYLERTGDYEGLEALPLFLSCRAALRAHVRASAAALAQEHERKEELRRDAQVLFGRASSYLEPATPCLTAVGGFSGTGKSTLAYGLAPSFTPAPGAIVLRSDIVRKQRASVAETSRLPDSTYTKESSAAIYAQLGDTAQRVLAAGYAAIVDAVYASAAERDAIKATAERAGVPFSGLWLNAPTELLEARIHARRGDASDATIDVLHRQLRAGDVPRDWRLVDASGSEQHTLDAAKAAMPQGVVAA